MNGEPSNRTEENQTAANDTTPHTPGPWGYCYDGSSTWSVGQAADPQDLPPYVAVFDRNDRRAQANARLIAAAPDLLELCKEMREWLRPEISLEPGRSFFWKLVNAINKAEGKRSTYGDSVAQRLPPENVRVP